MSGLGDVGIVTNQGGWRTGEGQGQGGFGSSHPVGQPCSGAPQHVEVRGEGRPPGSAPCNALLVLVINRARMRVRAAELSPAL